MKECACSRDGVGRVDGGAEANQGLDTLHLLSRGSLTSKVTTGEGLARPGGRGVEEQDGGAMRVVSE